MDIITKAILAAAAAGVTEMGKKAVLDAYDALKGAIKKRYGDDSKIAQAVTTVEKEPDFKPNQETLTGRVEQVNAAADPELQKLAQQLLDALKETSKGQEAMSKYNIQAPGSQIGVIGDHARVEGGMHFGNTGDTFKMSGDFRGANVNIKSKLQNVTQTIGALPNADPSAKAELARLTQQLNEALQQAPAHKGEEAEAVAQSAEALVEQAAQEKPNKTLVEITGEGLKKAAQNLADVTPIVLTIATQIVETIGRVVK